LKKALAVKTEWENHGWPAAKGAHARGQALEIGLQLLCALITLCRIFLERFQYDGFQAW